MLSISKYPEIEDIKSITLLATPVVSNIAKIGASDKQVLQNILLIRYSVLVSTMALGDGVASPHSHG